MKGVVAFSLVLCYLAVSDAWTCSEGPRLNYAQQIDAGRGLVVATDRYYPYFLIGGSWRRLSTLRTRHVTVGPAGLWATGTNNKVHKYVAGWFKQSSGVTMRQVDAGGDDQVVGVTPSWYAHCLKSAAACAYSGSGSLPWNNQARKLKYYSCSTHKGCWGVDMRNKIYHVKNVNPKTCGVSGWRTIPGGLVMIEAGTKGNVFGVNAAGKVFERLGITNGRPSGTHWRNIPMCMKIRHVSYDLGKLWVVTTSGLVMTCVH